MSDGRRAKRVATRLQAYLGRALIREIEDPRLDSLIITGVSVSDDLGIAHIGVRLMVGDDDPKLRRAAMQSLSHVAGRLRRGVAPELGLRRVPELRFDYDTGHDASRRVEELLEEIRHEPHAPDSGDPDSGDPDGGDPDSGDTDSGDPDDGDTDSGDTDSDGS